MRKPKPTHLKELQGNPGKRALNRHEPKPENTLGDPPSHMTDGAKDIWRYILEESPVGLIKTTDAIEMTLLCTSFDVYLQACEHLKREGMIQVNAVGEAVPSKWIAVMNKMSTDITRITSNMGMNPTARSRIIMDLGGSKKEESSFGSVAKRTSK